MKIYNYIFFFQEYFPLFDIQKKRLFVYLVRIDSDIEKLLVSMMSPL